MKSDYLKLVQPAEKIARFVVKVEPPLPKYFTKFHVECVEKGLAFDRRRPLKGPRP